MLLWPAGSGSLGGSSFRAVVFFNSDGLVPGRAALVGNFLSGAFWAPMLYLCEGVEASSHPRGGVGIRPPGRI